MSSVHEIYVSDADRSSAKQESWQEPQQTYRLHILTIREDDGRYSTVALNLPGTGSCGDTKEESIENAKEAIKAVLESHKEAGETIPWKDSTTEKIVNGEQKWIIVHVPGVSAALHDL